jgi:hypothetical protein
VERRVKEIMDRHPESNGFYIAAKYNSKVGKVDSVAIVLRNQRHYIVRQ